MKKKKTNLPKFLFGGTSDPFQSNLDIQRQRKSENPGVIENPNTALADNEIRKARAEQAAGDNVWGQMLDIIGPMLMQTGSSVMNQGMSGGDSIGGAFSGMFGGKSTKGMIEIPGATVTRAATGGTMGNTVEAEGDELMETPDGQVAELKGPSHEQGGIDLVVPDGTDFYSKRMKGPDGKTMAERKERREKKMAKISKLFEKNPGDVTLKSTIERTKKNTEREDAQDLEIMNRAKEMMEGIQTFLTGGTVEKFVSGGTKRPPNKYDSMRDEEFLAYAQNFLDMNPIGGKPTIYSGEDTDKKGFLDGLVGNTTVGDALGMYGTIDAMLSPSAITQANRAGDTPNVNSYLDYGKDSLKTIDESKKYVGQQRDANLKDLDLARTSSINRGRNSARGVNTMRALDMSVDSAVNAQQEKIYGGFAQQMMNILGQQAQIEGQRDQMVMRGEEGRDLADRQDRDAYFTQMAQDVANRATGIQKVGRDLNQMKTRDVTANIMADLFPNFNIDARTGDTKFVKEEIVKNANNYSRIANTATREQVLNNVKNAGWSWKGETLYNKEGQEVDLITLKPKE